VDIDDAEGTAAGDVVGRKVLQAEIFFNYKCNQQNKITFVDKHLFFLFDYFINLIHITITAHF
jgi:hypothetical protein